MEFQENTLIKGENARIVPENKQTKLCIHKNWNLASHLHYSSELDIQDKDISLSHVYFFVIMQ